jgi:hypothetical protein
VWERVKEERNILHTIKRRQGNWISHNFRRNCLLEHVIEGKIKGKIEETGRRGRRRKQLLGDIKKTRRFWKLKEDALHGILWRTRFGKGMDLSHDILRDKDEEQNNLHSKDSVRGSKRMKFASITKSCQWMLFREIIAVYCKNYTEHRNALWGQNAKFLVLKPVVHAVITVLQSVQVLYENK